MPKGHSAKPQSILDARYLLEQETLEGRIFLAGLALSYATGMSEQGGRQLTRRINSLRREHSAVDGEMLCLLNPPVLQIVRRANSRPNA